MNENILSAIGNTPLVRLTRVFGDLQFQLFAKLESFNPGGSMKDRPAYHIIKQALDTGEIEPGTVVIESSSGNMGVGLAQACSYYGIRFICVVDPKTTVQNILLLEAYGAEVDIVAAPDPMTGEYLQSRIERVRARLKSVKKGFWPNQYANVSNPAAHYGTMGEIVKALDGQVDYLFCATSTCGTLRGCAEYAQRHNLNTKVIAVDAVGSVIFGGRQAKRLIPGHGAAIRPQLYQPDLAARCIHVTDLDCIVGCRLLARQEAIIAGGSSGAVLIAMSRIKDEIPPGANCVMIMPDRGERYLETIYSNSWVKKNFGDVSHLWKGCEEVEQGVMAMA